MWFGSQQWLGPLLELGRLLPEYERVDIFVCPVGYLANRIRVGGGVKQEYAACKQAYQTGTLKNLVFPWFRYSVEILKPKQEVRKELIIL